MVRYTKPVYTKQCFIYEVEILSCTYVYELHHNGAVYTAWK